MFANNSVISEHENILLNNFGHDSENSTSTLSIAFTAASEVAIPQAARGMSDPLLQKFPGKKELCDEKRELRCMEILFSHV